MCSGIPVLSLRSDLSLPGLGKGLSLCELWGLGLGLELGWVVVPEFGVQSYCGQPSFSPCRSFSVMSQSISGLK
jgi:hypothetical protein